MLDALAVLDQGILVPLEGITFRSGNGDRKMLNNVPVVIQLLTELQVAPAFPDYCSSNSFCRVKLGL